MVPSIQSKSYITGPQPTSSRQTRPPNLMPLGKGEGGITVMNNFMQVVVHTVAKVHILVPNPAKGNLKV